MLIAAKYDNVTGMDKTFHRIAYNSRVDLWENTTKLREMDRDKRYNDVAIEDFIDLDDTSSHQLKGFQSKHKGYSFDKIDQIIELEPTSSPPTPSLRYPSSSPSSSSAFSSSSPFSRSTTAVQSTKVNDVIFDDEDIFISGSGSGSGSGDFHPGSLEDSFINNGRLTPTTKSSPMPSTAETSTSFTTDGKMPRELPVVDEMTGKDSIIVDQTFIDNDVDDESDDLFVEDADILYDVPDDPKPSISNNISPATWEPWSSWIGTSTKVRVRSCLADGRAVTDVACDGIKLQYKSCSMHGGRLRCSKPKNVTTFGVEDCNGSYRKIPQDNFMKAPPPPPRVPDAPPPMELRPNPDECLYSLYDNFRQKFVFSRWNLTTVITKSKVKRWCDKKSGQYLVMTTPIEHCRQYYKDLCKVSTS
ncbi:hypothetical protein PoB_004898800 [Plakobranchus ocellatus]|uniref:Uncharacterized protein n=1 Tax=Plakobranchus ocellatus TaxID=259542 RepID=A0AAV4BUK0_9GAST|nr:hypothetical protein PoB_004898800 [Plakobranchus ocellatus]